MKEFFKKLFCWHKWSSKTEESKINLIGYSGNCRIKIRHYNICLKCKKETTKNYTYK